MKVPLRLVGLYSIFFGQHLRPFCRGQDANGNGETNGKRQRQWGQQHQHQLDGATEMQHFSFCASALQIPVCFTSFCSCYFLATVWTTTKKKSQKKNTQKIMWSARERNNNNKMWEKGGTQGITNINTNTNKAPAGFIMAK